MAEIVVCDISKKFGQQVVLDHISMKLSSPHIYGLVGRNGSGKTMLMRHLCGFVRPDSGKILIDGKVLNKEIEKPEKLGIIIENPGFLPEYSGYYNLHLFALIQNKIKKEEIREAMRIVGLDPDSKKHVGKYSLGMRQRLGIAQAIMEKPRLLILDEPFNGLDVQGVKDIRELLMSLQKQGVTILLASHYDEDIRTLCEEVYLVREHRIRKKEESDGAEK